MGFNIPKFNLPKFSLPNISLPKINLPKINVPRINLPNPQKIFGTAPGSQPRTVAPKPNLLQRAANFGQSFVKNPVAATQRLQQKVTNKVTQFRTNTVNTARNIKSGTVSNFNRGVNQVKSTFSAGTTKVGNAANYIKRGTVSNFKKVGTQFTRFENWADKGIKNNHKWSQQNRNSKNLLNRATANANLGFTKVAKGTNNVINTSSDYYRGLRKSNNILVKGAGYAGGLATSIGRGLTSPVTFADPRLSGKQRSSQVRDGLLSYIPVGKVIGLGGKALKPIGGQIAKRFPGLVGGGTKLIGKGQNIINQVSRTKVGAGLTNRVINPAKKGLTNINNTLNRKLTFKDVRNLPQTIGNGFNKLRGLGKGVKPTSVKGNPLRNINTGTRQKLANSGKLPMTARANAKNSVENLINQVISGNVPQNARLAKNLQNSLPKQFQGSAEELMKKRGFRSSTKKTVGDYQYNASAGGERYTAKAIEQAAKLQKAYGADLKGVPTNGRTLGKPLTDKIRTNDVLSKGRRGRLVGSTPQLFDGKGNRTQMAKDILKIMKNEKNKYGNPSVITGAEAQKAGIKPVWNGSTGTIKGNDRLIWQDAYVAKNGSIVKEGYVPFRKGQKFDNGHLEAAAEIWNKNAHHGGANNSTIQRKMNDPANYRVENSTQNRSKGSDGIEYENITVVSPLRSPLPRR